VRGDVCALASSTLGHRRRRKSLCFYWKVPAKHSATIHIAELCVPERAYLRRFVRSLFVLLLRTVLLDGRDCFALF
jgi:hypothetical protein